ncbi:putative Sodium/potassium-transporting ATPase subunit beta-1 [Operophtera brumata]|uniref:Putative Sodium/potassium-transporting ATPase subunit beta-1 n=1 Tax=Operophtera brumata TaxID=104452 RepID=A0A0L7LI47_OPEBR|nr:putative Sodium/potassium-transporting ATPase subunit beta-1 [Operophtera brumata]
MPREGKKPTTPVVAPRIRDPSIPASIPATSHEEHTIAEKLHRHRSSKKRFCDYIYNKEYKTFCNRTCQSWFYIISYSIIYLLFLATYTLFFLFGSLWIIRSTTDFENIDTTQMLTYSGNVIGLSATPTASDANYPLIWYRKGRSEDYEKYINALDGLLVRQRRTRELDVLGPCGTSPYGYGDNPCVILRVNKQFHWEGKPLVANSSETKIAPIEVQRWLKQDKKLWLHCSGHHAYDKEHVGRVRYFPDPPGFDPGLFPLRTENSPVIAIQISNYTVGLSIAVECKLWYVGGPSSVNFMLYVAPNDKISRRS